jgi:hypothetical protein
MNTKYAEYMVNTPFKSSTHVAVIKALTDTFEAPSAAVKIKHMELTSRGGEWVNRDTLGIVTTGWRIEVPADSPVGKKLASLETNSQVLRANLLAELNKEFGQFNATPWATGAAVERVTLVPTSEDSESRSTPTLT